ncbi:hypothetical protein HZC30_00065 [Candidatus Woesearchaeota archaeon]|nr:hypothetical protein [Candidatus Woesearchaeota archaeon]
MSIEDKFDQVMKEWKEYCQKPEVQCDSNPEVVLNCRAFKRMVKLGPTVLPLVRKLYEEDDSKCFELSIIKGIGLTAVVRGIVDEEFTIPDELRGKVNAIQDYTKGWLDENMHKYAI